MNSIRNKTIPEYNRLFEEANQPRPPPQGPNR